ncbi:MAG: DNA-binding protein WhiA [Oscillospiraceae bacterium]|nr:DNA-binding protein WhiA [Oscillospiraceae bacterium]
MLTVSFSSNAKAELCRQPIARKCCAVSECFGILLYCNTFQSGLVRVVTESADFAARLPRLFKKAFGLSFDQTPSDGRGKLVFQVTDREKLQKIHEAFGFSPEGDPALHVNYGVLENECCVYAFLRGAFLAGGSVTDPEKRYHLELSTTHYKVGRETHALMRELDLSPKETERAGCIVLYFKQSDSIEDFLTAVGAPVCAMGIMEAKVEKELINGVNRRVNCETANLTKVVDAAQEQLAAIRLLERAGKMENLPQKLRETAALRQDNPEATLTELSELTDPPVTKSAMNHRMRKLIELAKE